MNKPVDSFRMSAHSKEIDRLTNENAALKAQFNELLLEAQLDSDFVEKVLNKSPQACLSEHNSRIEEEVIERIEQIAGDYFEIYEMDKLSMALNDMPRKYASYK